MARWADVGHKEREIPKDPFRGPPHVAAIRSIRCIRSATFLRREIAGD